MATVSSSNTDIDYLQKDFDSSVDAIISFANINYGPGTSANRLWTNFNIDSFSRNWLEIVAFISDVFFFYFDNQATQTYLQTATVTSAINNIAKQFGFTPSSASSASGVGIFTISTPGTVSRGYVVQATNGNNFYLTNDIVAGSSGTYTGTVLQGTIKVETFSAQGLQSEEFNLSGPNIVVDLTNINSLDISPQISVNGNSYTLVNSFVRFNGTNQPAVIDSLGEVIGGGGRVYTLDTRPDGTPFITFGDGVFGRKLLAGETLTVTYRSGGGSSGNIGVQTLTTPISSNPIVSSVNNTTNFSGGNDAQSIEQLRDLIPASLSTLQRAVARQDYADILTSNFTSVFAAEAEVNKNVPGIDLNIYVVPQGNGITKITDNTVLLTNLSSFLDRRKTVTVQFQILDAFGVDTLIGLEIHIGDTISKSATIQAINTALEKFFSLTTGGESGSGVGFSENILLKDINNIVEGITGIVRFEIKKLTYRPRIQQNIVGLLSTYSNSLVSIYPNVSTSEWLIAASGSVTKTSGTTLFSNTSLYGFTYTSGTGIIAYAFPVDLTKVATGDTFKDGAGSGFTILAVDTLNSQLTIPTSQSVNTTVTLPAHGEVLSGATSYSSFKCFKKILATSTNLSINSITDNNLDLSVLSGTGTALSSRILLDNTNIFIPGQYANNKYYLVDSSSNIWEIISNDSSTLKTSISAVNDGAITSVASGNYIIVNKLVGKQVTFNGEIFNIQYNNVNTLFSIGADFSQIGTIGDNFTITSLQTNIGNLGIPLDLISYDSVSGKISLNNAPDLSGVNSSYMLLDSSGQIFNIVGVNNISSPSTSYSYTNQDTTFTIPGSGNGVEVAQGFKVPTTSTYSVVSFNLANNGNISGNLTATIVNDSGGLPNLSSVVAVSQLLSASSISKDTFTKVVFSFATPPTLTSGTQYHLVLSGDGVYNSTSISGVLNFTNTGLVSFSYNPVSGVVTYSSSINLSSVVPGNYFKDSALNLFRILAVDPTNYTVTLAPSLSVVTTTPTSSPQGSIIQNDRILIGLDSSSPTYTNGEFSRFDGSIWSNSTLGPNNNYTDSNGTPHNATLTDCIFSIEGTKNITVESNLTPIMGPGATISTRYYDDNSEISLIIGISNGIITSATDANALGLGTVSSVPNKPIDNFVFRTSSYSDDIVNLRLNEIPELKTSDVSISIFGGID